ncbi:MAG: response regulator transcription factor [Burkholderiaceae bacterium]
MPPKFDTHLLVVEDDSVLGADVVHYLSEAGFWVDWAQSAEKAMPILSAVGALVAYDALIFDLSLSGVDSIALVRSVRSLGIATPVLVVSSKEAAQKRIDGLNAGADDCLDKPFDFTELVARVRALVRRSKRQSGSTKHTDNFEISSGNQTVRVSGTDIPLQAHELAVLSCLLNGAGSVISYQRLELAIKETGYSLMGPASGASDGCTDIVELAVSGLKLKLGNNLIRLIRGVGYCLGRDSGSNSSVDRGTSGRA